MNNILFHYRYELTTLLFMCLIAVPTKLVTVVAAKVQFWVLWCCRACKLDWYHSYFVDDLSSTCILVETDLCAVANLFCSVTNQTIQLELANRRNSIQLYPHILPICYDLQRILNKHDINRSHFLLSYIPRNSRLVKVTRYIDIHTQIIWYLCFYYINNSPTKCALFS